MGKVYLVGAGCGSLELYTVKAMRCIQKADCLIYDHLIDSQILEMCSSHCEMIYVGKQAHHHTMPQEKINQLLVEKAQQYAHVVRLKGGDVYVFGRGGEEGQTLFENYIDFEVVPGVSSALAGLAYAGIPITHRGMAAGFQVYTAQLKHNQERQFDFTKMLDDCCTYVFLMGMAKLDRIVEGFLKAGKNKETPIAVISQASMPTQQCLVGTLENIQMLFSQNPLPKPGIIVVGKVVEMRKSLNFYENKPLFSKKILVTSVGKDHFLYEHLRDWGADVTEVKTGEIIYEDIKIPRMKGYLVFTSQHGVIGFMKNFLKQYRDVRALAHMKLICIGEKTNQYLNQYGLNADYIPSVADSDYLNKELKTIVKDEDVYLALGEQKTRVHIHNHELCVYRNRHVEITNTQKHYDYAFFTCASSVRRFHEANQSCIDVFISIGAHTTKAIHVCYGDVKVIEVEKSTKEEMLKAVLKERKSCFIEEDV